MMHKYLFGKFPINKVAHSNVHLPCHPIKPIDPKDLKSLAKKYHAISDQYKHYYPDISSIKLIDNNSDAIDGTNSNTNSRHKTLSKKGKDKVSKSTNQKTKKKKKRPRSIRISGVTTSDIVGRPKNCHPRDLP
mmetsp:Transcript_24819/g.28598  ORF Transcript_24819/g.28598 Transcript_24819/m.28598 type:complete len:133 (+) Transcript_24819:502-900(+)|eukprot:CAMPEP_0194407802 /NCGR_PEP_ID=MMETSP0176-20130528/5778_1 /TAXON_ID=216777 /ORGANISM="Proboscia alata, Strain PI-D3" /LENGTH=132 /DNA_ID=CAMNT_0039207615 /DNA_START=472 /DNA_END=866 /DNA_ORIENTATION=-